MREDRGRRSSFRKMKVLATAALLLLTASSSSPEEVAAEGPRLFFCPGYRAAPVNADREYGKVGEPFPLPPPQEEGGLLPTSRKLGIELRRADPDPRFFGWNFFGCLVYNLASFGHHVLEFFLPYYGYPYYRVGWEPHRIPAPVPPKPAN